MINGSKFIPCKNSRIVVVLGIGIVTGISVRAQTKLVSGTNYALTQKGAVRRDPFWPVGYRPKSTQEAAPKKKIIGVAKRNWNDAMKKVVINGVSSRANNEFFAVINGQVKSVGDTVTLNHEGIFYTWSVDSITPPGSVKLRRVLAR